MHKYYMTPQDLASQIVPKIQESAEYAKNDILGSLPPLKRVFLKPLWPYIMTQMLPTFTLMIVQFLIAAYRKQIEPTVGPFVNELLKAMDEEEVPQLKTIHEILQLLHTPSSEFHPCVQECLNPNIVHDLPNYEEMK